MTDKERKKICDDLRYWQLHRDTGETLGKTLAAAREEIEQLEKELVELKQTFKAAAIKLGDPRSRQHPERQRKF